MVWIWLAWTFGIVTFGMWWWLAFGGDNLLAPGWFEGYSTCFFGNSVTDDILWHLKRAIYWTKSKCGERLEKIRRDKRKKIANDFSCCATRKIFSSRFCFASAICFHFYQFRLSASKTYFSNYQHRLDELLHKIFLDFAPSKQSIGETNNRIFYFYFFWTYWFSEVLCFFQHI